jgi:hypothetical protein
VTSEARPEALPGTLPGAGSRFGVRSMSAALRRVLLRSPAVTGDFAGADWRAPDPVLLVRQHEEFGQLLRDLGCEVEAMAPVEGLVDATSTRGPGPRLSRLGARCTATTARRSPSRGTAARPA